MMSSDERSLDLSLLNESSYVLDRKRLGCSCKLKAVKRLGERNGAKSMVLKALMNLIVTSKVT